MRKIFLILFIFTLSIISLSSNTYNIYKVTNIADLFINAEKSKTLAREEIYSIKFQYLKESEKEILLKEREFKSLSLQMKYDINKFNEFMKFITENIYYIHSFVIMTDENLFIKEVSIYSTSFTKTFKF